MDKDIQAKNLKLRTQVIKSVSKLFFVFIFTAILGMIFGNFLNDKLDIAPWGSIISLFICYLGTWAVIFWYYRRYIAPILLEEDRKDKEAKLLKKNIKKNK